MLPCATIYVGGRLKAPTRKMRSKTMTPNETTTTAAETAVPVEYVQKTVFDLLKFDDVMLKKPITLPNRPTTIEEALAAVGNDSAKLLNVIHDGLKADARERAKADMTGFLVVGEDDELGEVYTGKYADEAKGKLINNAILSIAKMQGYDKSLPPEKKRELKEKATTFLRENPAMLATIQG